MANSTMVLWLEEDGDCIGGGIRILKANDEGACDGEGQWYGGGGKGIIVSLSQDPQIQS